MQKTDPINDPDTLRWTAERQKRSLKFSELPLDLQQKLKPTGRGPQKEPTKVKVSIRLSQDVVDALRATGSGWQSRVDEALRAFVKLQHKKA
jgi:uncharacterized protein (DUF4415 family)